MVFKAPGQPKKLWLPAGWVIPTFKDGKVHKLKVRRKEWHANDPLPKYIEISGSKSCPAIYGDTQKDVVIIVESEFDAILIQQEAHSHCFSIALGGCTKRPDYHTDELLNKTSLILWCLDNDEAGKKAALWWREAYPNLRFWPVPIGKSPGDAFKDHGIKLSDWVLEGIAFYSKQKKGVKMSKKRSREDLAFPVARIPSLTTPLKVKENPKVVKKIIISAIQAAYKKRMPSEPSQWEADYGKKQKPIVTPEEVEFVTHLIESLEPSNAIEAALASQFAIAYIRGLDLTVDHYTSIDKALNLFKFGNEVLETLSRFRTKGAQVISVNYNHNQGQINNIQMMKQQGQGTIEV